MLRLLMVRLVREQAFRAMHMFMQRLTAMVEDMVSRGISSREKYLLSQPDTVLSSESQSSAFGPVTTTSTANGTGQAGLVNSATGAAGALAGWAISSLSKQLATSEAHSTLSASSNLAPSHGQGTNGLSGSSTPTFSPSPQFNAEPSFSSSSRLSSQPTVPVPGFGSAKPTTSRSTSQNRTTTQSSSSSAGGMKLSAKPKPTSNLADTLASEWDDGEAANAWGTDDLIDVNADEDDWAAFESAPIPEIVVPPPQSYYVAPAQSKPQSQSQSNGRATSNAAGSTSASPGTNTSTYANANANIAAKPPILAPAIRAKSPAVASATPSQASFDGWDDNDNTSETGSASLHLPPAGGAGGSSTSLAGLSKEEKDKEMARRREERKARIAAMKEQKKGKA